MIDCMKTGASVASVGLAMMLFGVALPLAAASPTFGGTR